MMEIKAVIFDLDGTLYDNTHLAKLLILRNIFNLKMLYAERMCRHMMSGRYFGGKGATYKVLFSRMAKQSHNTEEKAASWYWNRYMPLQVSLLRRHFHKKSWVDGTLAALREKGIRLVCFSEYSFVREKLMAVGIDPAAFDYIIDAPTAGGCKPCRKAFLYISKKINCYPADILMVGDREDTDGAGAEAANMQFLLVPKKDVPVPELMDGTITLKP